MKRKTTIKGLLLAALLMGGVNFAWGQTSLYEKGTIGHVWANTDKDGTSTGSWLGDGLSATSISGGLKFDATANNEVYYSYNFTSYYQLSYDIVWNVGSASQDAYANKSYIKIGNNIEFNYYSRSNTKTANVVINGTSYKLTNYYSNSGDFTIHVEIDAFTNKLKVLTISGSNQITSTGSTDNSNFEYNLNDITSNSEILLTSNPTFSPIRFGVERGNGHVYSTLKSIVIKESNANNVFEYSVNYIDGNSNTVKTVSAPNYAGETIPVQRIITGDDEKEYIVTDANLPSQTIQDDSENASINTINLNVRKRYAATMTIKKSYDGIVDESVTSVTPLAESESFAHSWMYYYPYYEYKNSKYYKATLVGGSSFGEEGTFEYNNINRTIAYTADSHVVAYVDGNTSNSKGLSYSNYKYSSVSANAELTITGELEAGKYELEWNPVNARNTIIKYYIGDDATEIMTIKNKGTYYFTLPSNVTKLVGVNTSQQLYYDYIIVRTLPSSANVTASDNLGYTFSSMYPLDFSGTDIRAYIAKYTNGDKVSLHRVYKVPANTGLLIFSDSELTNLSIPTTTAATDDVTDNVLVAQSTTGNVAQTKDGKTNYVLGMVDKNDTSKGSSFFKVPSTGVSVGEGKAYLSINYTAASRLNIVFEDEATGIEAMHNAQCTMHNEMYDLQGRRVAQPSKGLYIVNGKKVVIK